MDKLLECTTVDEMINTIFKEAYKEKLMCYYEKDGKNKKLERYSIELKNMKSDKFDKIHLFYKLPFVAEKKAKSIILGLTNESDEENRLQEGRGTLFYVLLDVFSGNKNDKLEDKLKINDVEDIKKIILDKALTKKMYRYIMQYVELSLRTYTQKKSNPDYSFSKNKYERIEYEYLDREDKDDEDSKPVQLEYKESYKSTGDKTKYIFDNYYQYLTNKQKLFVNAALEYGILNSCISDHKNNLLYTHEDIKQYKKNIRKRLEDKIESDIHIKNVNGRWCYNE